MIETDWSARASLVNFVRKIHFLLSFCCHCWWLVADCMSALVFRVCIFDSSVKYNLKYRSFLTDMNFVIYLYISVYHISYKHELLTMFVCKALTSLGVAVVVTGSISAVVSETKRTSCRFVLKFLITFVGICSLSEKVILYCWECILNEEHWYTGALRDIFSRVGI